MLSGCFCGIGLVEVECDSVELAFHCSGVCSRWSEGEADFLP